MVLNVQNTSDDSLPLKCKYQLLSHLDKGQNLKSTTVLATFKTFQKCNHYDKREDIKEQNFKTNSNMYKFHIMYYQFHIYRIFYTNNMQTSAYQQLSLCVTRQDMWQDMFTSVHFTFKRLSYHFSFFFSSSFQCYCFTIYYPYMQKKKNTLITLHALHTYRVYFKTFCVSSHPIIFMIIMTQLTEKKYNKNDIYDLGLFLT